MIFLIGGALDSSISRMGFFFYTRQSEVDGMCKGIVEGKPILTSYVPINIQYLHEIKNKSSRNYPFFHMFS